MTIVRLNGTHGSGKSTTATRVMNKYGFEKVHQDGQKRPIGYMSQLPNGELLFIVGPYETACGGCDAVQPFARIWPLVEFGIERATHVLFEGALLSTTFGHIGTKSEQYGDDFVWAFMDTPMLKCQERVNQRRAVRGAEPLADFVNVNSKWQTIDRLRLKLIAGEVGTIGPRKTVLINHQHPAKDVFKLFGVRLTKEPI